MKIGLVGYQSSGKSTLFQWLTGMAADPSLSHTTQAAMAEAPDARIDALCQIYHPKKVVHASLELVDTPGLDRAHQGNAARLALIRDTHCMVVVLAAYDGSDPVQDLARFEEDLLLADLEIVTGRVERLRESIKKPRPNRDEQIAELAALELLLEPLEAGRPLRELELSDQQVKAIRSFQLLSGKPRLVVVNLADDGPEPDRFHAQMPEPVRYAGVPLRLELELSQMSPREQEEFRREMGVQSGGSDELLRAMLDVSGQMLFFTASEKEVRSWLLGQGQTAVDAAGSIHTDLARGFIRCETISAADLIQQGSERDAKAASLFRQEPKDYLVKDGDVLHIRFSV